MARSKLRQSDKPLPPASRAAQTEKELGSLVAVNERNAAHRFRPASQHDLSLACLDQPGSRGNGFHAGTSIQGSRFEHNIARGNEGDGLFFCAGVTAIHVTGNQFLNNKRNGIGDIGNDDDTFNMVSNNFCVGNGCHGIEAKGGNWSVEEEEAFKAPIRQQYEAQGHPYYATARLWDDGIIDPADTRRVLALGLAATRRAPIPEPKFGVFRM